MATQCAISVAGSSGGVKEVAVASFTLTPPAVSVAVGADDRGGFWTQGFGEVQSVTVVQGRSGAAGFDC